MVEGLLSEVTAQGAPTILAEMCYVGVATYHTPTGAHDDIAISEHVRTQNPSSPTSSGFEKEIDSPEILFE